MKRIPRPIPAEPRERPADSPALLDVANPFTADYGCFRVFEPPGTPAHLIHQRLCDGSYDKPFILDDGRLRFLHFGLDHIQSVMRIDKPDRLDLRYTQKMMAFLLYLPQPERLLMLGLGGGSLAKFCYRHLPATRISVVEIDPLVIALRRQFMVPDDDARFEVLQGDGASHVRSLQGGVDVLLVDAFDKRGLAPAVASPDFLAAAHGCLNERGILVMNLTGTPEEHAPFLQSVAAVFEQQQLLITVRNSTNLILFAFRNRHHTHDWPLLAVRARELQKRIGLDLSAFVKKGGRTRTCKSLFAT